MDFHLNDTDVGCIACNSRNGYGKKTLRNKFWHLELSTPRDRYRTFESQIIPKRSTKSTMLEEAILSLYANGMTTRDIQATLHDLYHVDMSLSLISKVTSRLGSIQWSISAHSDVSDIIVQNRKSSANVKLCHFFSRSSFVSIYFL